METKSVINITATRCPPETVERFDKWYSEKHVPDVLKFKGIRRATRYKVIGGGDKGSPTFLTIYEFKDRQDLEAYDNSPEKVVVHEDWLKVKEETGAEMVWRVQCEAIKTWQR